MDATGDGTGDGAGDRDESAPRKRSVTLAGHRTSLSLEAAFWDALAAFAREDGLSISRLLTEIDSRRTANLSSAARVYVLRRLQDRLIPLRNRPDPPQSD